LSGQIAELGQKPLPLGRNPGALSHV
jgi:hypothetical protein